MQKKRIEGVLYTILIAVLFFFPKSVLAAGYCASNTTVYQWACLAYDCSKWASYGFSSQDSCICLAGLTYVCQHNVNRGCTSGGHECDAFIGTAPYYLDARIDTGPCVMQCTTYRTGSVCTDTGYTEASCTDEANGCHTIDEFKDCKDSYGNCALVTPATKGCWVAGTNTPGVTNTSTPVVSTNTPTTIPTTMIRARAVTLSGTATSCSDIYTSTNYRDGTVFDLTSSSTSLGKQTQSGSNYVSWNMNTSSSKVYTIVPTSDGSSTISYCLYDGTSHYFGHSSVTPDSTSTYTFTVGYGQPAGWYQTQGGDVYAANRIVSFIPSTAATPQFSIKGLPAGNGYPGLVTYGSTSSTPYDFAASTSDEGSSIVSATNWLANNVFSPTRNFYEYYFAGFGSPTTIDYDHVGTITKPASRATPYVVSGDMTTSGDWTVSAGQNLIFLVDGNLTIGGNINITGNGMIVFIVKGDITVDPSVGTTYDSTTPVVEGVYLTNGAFHTGTSSVTGAERFVGKGIFIGNNFSLERDLNNIGQNGVYAAELFIYNPQLYMELPTQMKETSVASWQEVAP